jgi:hypothetical protein
MVTERTIINALIIGASFFLVPFVVSETLTVGDYLPALFFAGLLALVIAFFFLKERLCMGPLLAGSISGGFNFFGMPLQAVHILCFLLILYYVTGYVVIKQRRIKLGKTALFWPSTIVVLIILYHNHDVKLGMLGGDTMGGKPAILIFLVYIAYFCGINIPTPPVSFFAKIPLYSVIITAISSIPYLVTTIFPGLAPYIYMFTTSVNVEAYVDTLASVNTTGPLTKLAALGPLGFSLQLYLLCHYPIGTWLRPERWWIAGVSLICLILEASSGYRNVMFNFLLMTMVGAWCYHSWRSMILPIVAGLSLVGLVLASSNNLIQLPVRNLPIIAQRTLSFLPADWDEEAIDSAQSSNLFRKNIEDVYLKEYANRSPLIGNGFDIDKKEFEYYNGVMAKGQGIDPEYAQAKLFIEGKMFHTGWISVYDNVGILGMIAFIILGWSEIRMASRLMAGPRTDRKTALFPLYVWAQCNLVTMLVSYFAVFGSFQDTFSNFIIYGILLSHLLNIAKERDVPPVLSGPKKAVEFSGVNGANYGY